MSAEAIADDVCVAFAGRLPHPRPSAAIGPSTCSRRTISRRRVAHPVDQEITKRVTLLDRPTDEEFRGPQIEDVELVDPGRMISNGRRFTFRRRRVLDQLHQIVLVDDLPGVAATFSPILNAVGSVMLIARRPLPRSRSSSRFFETVDQVLAALSIVARSTSGLVKIKLDGAIASTSGLIEIDLACGVIVQTFDILDRAQNAAGAQQVALFYEIDSRAVIPRLVAKRRSLRRGLDPPVGALPRGAGWCAATASHNRSNSDICARPTGPGPPHPGRHLVNVAPIACRVGQADAVVR